MTAATPTEFRSARLMCDAHGAASVCALHSCASIADRFHLNVSQLSKGARTCSVGLPALCVCVCGLERVASVDTCGAIMTAPDYLRQGLPLCSCKACGQLNLWVGGFGLHAYPFFSNTVV